MINVLKSCVASTIAASAMTLAGTTTVSSDGHTAVISVAFPYEMSFVEMNGSQMAYVDEGQGPVVLFLLGNQTSPWSFSITLK